MLLLVCVLKVLPGIIEPLGRSARVRDVYVEGREGAMTQGGGSFSEENEPAGL